MFRLGLRLGSTAKQYIKDAVVLYERGLCDYIELLAEPGSYDNCIAAWKGLNIPYVIQGAHLQHGLSLSSKETFIGNMKVAFEALKFADALAASRIIFSPGVGGDIHETVRQLREIRDGRIFIENMPYISFSGQIGVGSSPEEIAFLQKEANVGFCFDLGHAIRTANALFYEHEAFVLKMLSLNPLMFHVADGDKSSIFSRNFHFGAGSYDFSYFTKNCPSDAPLTLLCPHFHNESLDDFVADALFVKKMAKERVESSLTFRQASWKDINHLFDLANDSDVRLNSFSQGKIPYAAHVAWFAKNYADNTVLLFVIWHDEEFVGTVRFAPEGGVNLTEAKISISLHKKFRGLGLGVKVLEKALQLVQEVGAKKVFAYIFDHNTASKKLFLNTGFIAVGQDYAGERVFGKYCKDLA